jgi:hypothetical protein
VLAFRPVVSPDPPSEPDVHVPTHPALHEAMPGWAMMGASSCSLALPVQLGVHLQYPRMRVAGVHRRPPGIAALPLRSRCPPLPCGRLSRPPWWDVTPTTTTGPVSLPTPLADGEPSLRQRGMLAGGWRRSVPTFVLDPFDGVGVQLCPWGLAMGTPQSFPMASWPSFTQRLRSRPKMRACTPPRPISTRLEPVLC